MDLLGKKVDPVVVYVKFDSKRGFGVEMEVNQKVALNELRNIVQKNDLTHQVITSSTYTHSNGNNYWHIKFDRSCGDVYTGKASDKGGWEVASYIARGYKDITNISEIARKLKDSGVVVNNNCALHVHGDVSDFSQEQVATLVAHWMRIESVISEIVPKHRRNGKFCRLLTKKFPIKSYSLNSFWQTVKPVDFSDADRKVALNICGYCSYKRPTVELRLPEGTLDHKDVRNWIRMFVHYIDNVKHMTFPANIEPAGLMETLQILGLHGDKSFVILSKSLRETKMWLMNRILKFSTKRKLREEAEDFLLTLELPRNEGRKVSTVGDFWWKKPGAMEEIFGVKNST
jgi:hypothetical protein